MWIPWLWHLRGLFKEPTHVSELLPWYRTVSEGIILLKDESLMHTLRIQPPDLDALSPVARSEVLLQMDRAWQRFEPGWAIWNEAMRAQVHETLPQTFTNPAALRVDQAQQAQATQETRWRTFQYLSLCHNPEVFEESKLSRVFFSRAAVSHVSDARRLEMFCDQVMQFTDLLKACSASVHHCTNDEQWTYLHNTCSEQMQEVVADELGTDLDYRLADTEVWGGIAPRLGTQYVKVITLRNFPAKTRERMLRRLERVGIKYRWVTRWFPTASQDAAKAFADRQSGWQGTRMGVGQWMYEHSTGRDSQLKNRHVDRQADDADVANDEVLSELVGYGGLTHLIVLMHEDRAILQEQVRQVLSIVRGTGCVAVVERLNAFEALLSSWPGERVANVRRYTLSTLNGIHLTRHSDPGFGAPVDRAVCMATTDRVVPYPIDLRVGHVRHTLILGRTESGKSSIMNFLNSQTLRDPEAQIFTIEFEKRSARSMVLCHGGDYHDLEHGTAHFQPLASIHIPTERAKKHAWLAQTILAPAQVELNSVTTPYLEAGLDRLSKEPGHLRTMSQLVLALSAQSRARQRGSSLIRYVDADTRDTSMQDKVSTLQESVISAIERFTQGHVWGYVLDADHDSIGSNPVHGFALESILKNPRLLEPTVSYLWDALLQRLDGRVTNIAMDECSFGLKIPFVYQQINEGLRLLREKNGALLLGTQNPLDITDSQIGPLLLDNCMTWILGPNTEANAPAIKPVYVALGLNESLIDDLAGATPRQDYLFCQGATKRFITVKLAHASQVICAASSPEDHLLMDEVERTRGERSFFDVWVEAKHLEG